MYDKIRCHTVVYAELNRLINKDYDTNFTMIYHIEYCSPNLATKNMALHVRSLFIIISFLSILKLTLIRSIG